MDELVFKRHEGGAEKLHSNEAAGQSFDRFMKSLEKPHVSLEQVRNLVQTLSSGSPLLQQRLYAFQEGNGKNLNHQLTSVKQAEVAQEDLKITQRIQTYIHAGETFSNSLSDLQKSMDSSTTLSTKAMDKIVGIFTDDTVFNTYQNSFNLTKSQAKEFLTRLENELGKQHLSPSQKQLYLKAHTILSQSANARLESTGVITMGINEIKAAPQNAKNTLYAIGGEVVGIKDGLVGIVEGVFDLGKFLVEFSIDEKYRDKVLKQIKEIAVFCQENGISGTSNVVFDALKKELAHIGTLPQEEQAFAIGKIAGNVISSLVAIKGAMVVGGKLKKIAQAERIIEKGAKLGKTPNLSNIEGLDALMKSKRGLQATELLLNGVAETVLLSTAVQLFQKLSKLPKTFEAIKQINIARKQIELSLPKAQPSEKQILQTMITKLDEETHDIKTQLGVKKTIDRSKKAEDDIQRHDVELTNRLDFPELSPEKRALIATELKDVIGSVKYNSYEKLDKLFTLFFEMKATHPETTLKDAYRAMSFSELCAKEGSNCVGMSKILKQRLDEHAIDSYLVRFDAGGLLSDKFVENGHAALVIPFSKGGEKYYTLADPGLLISEPITFKKGGNSQPFELGGSRYIIKSEAKDDLPYMMEIGKVSTPDKPPKKLYFDAEHEWDNPDMTLNRDIMRALKDYKIVKQDSNGKPTSFFKFDIDKGQIELMTGGRKDSLAFDEFLHITTQEDKYNFFQGVLQDLDIQKPEEFLAKNQKIIQYVQDYKDQIRVPSAKKNLPSN